MDKNDQNEEENDDEEHPKDTKQHQSVGQGGGDRQFDANNTRMDEDSIQKNKKKG